MKISGLIIICIVLLFSCKKKIDNNSNFLVHISETYLTPYPDPSFFIEVKNNVPNGYNSAPFRFKVNLISDKKVKTLIEETNVVYMYIDYFAFDSSYNIEKDTYVKLEVIIEDKYIYSKYVLVK